MVRRPSVTAAGAINPRSICRPELLPKSTNTICEDLPLPLMHDISRILNLFIPETLELFGIPMWNSLAEHSDIFVTTKFNRGYMVEGKKYAAKREASRGSGAKFNFPIIFGEDSGAKRFSPDESIARNCYSHHFPSCLAVVYMIYAFLYSYKKQYFPVILK